MTLSTAKTFQNLYGYTCRVGLAMPKYSPLKPKADQVLGPATSWKNSCIRIKTIGIKSKLQQNLKFWRKADWLSPVWWTCGWRRWGISPSRRTRSGSARWTFLKTRQDSNEWVPWKMERIAAVHSRTPQVHSRVRYQKPNQTASKKL